MKMKAEFMGTLEVTGDISKLTRQGDWLILNVKTTAPVGWNVRAAFSHRDLMSMAKFMLKPSVLLYVIFGFGKPKDEKKSPDY